MMERTYRVAATGILTMMLLCAGICQVAEKPKSDVAFEQLSSLVGEWNGVHDGTNITVNYTMTADGSALMEEFRPANKPAMITMFSVDGDHLVATHYCSAGNQPQMATGPITDPKGKIVSFSLVRITGMKTPDDWHNTGLEIQLEDKDNLIQKWTWEAKGKAGTTMFHFSRRKLEKK
jgi:hypothetical protein